MTRFLLLRLAVAVSLGVSSAFAQAPSGAALSTDLTAKVDQVFASYDKQDSPGCALAVIKDGAIVYKRGYGVANLDHDIPIKPDTPFHVASVSKQFTAMAILLLAKDGKLSIHDPVRKHIPELRDFGTPLTIRHLLHHTSGLRDQWDLLILSGWRLSEDVVRDDDVLDLVGRMKALNFPPGDRFLYSNTGYTLAATIVKRVSGQSLREFTSERIFKPLGMTRTFFRDDHAVIVKNQAYGYQGAANNTFKLSVPTYDTVGASSLVTTVEDLARWDQNFYDGKIGGAALIEQMETPGKLNGGVAMGYGLGLAVGSYKGLRVVEHGGADAGYRSQLMRFPEQKFSVACLCNLGSTAPAQLARKVADIYLAEQLKPEAAPPAAGSGVKLTEAQLAGKVGIYWTADTEEPSNVMINDGKLFIAVDGNRVELIPLSESKFQFGVTGGEITFETVGENSRRLTIHLPGRNPVLFEALDTTKPSPEQLAEYTGNYYGEEIDTIFRFSAADSKLTMTRRKYKAIEMQPIARDVFMSSGGSVRFTRDAQNRITGMVYSRGRIKKLRFDKLAK